LEGEREEENDTVGLREGVRKGDGDFERETVKGEVVDEGVYVEDGVGVDVGVDVGEVEEVLEVEGGAVKEAV